MMNNPINGSESRDREIDRKSLRIIALGDCNSNTIDVHQGTVPAATHELFSEAGFRVEMTNHARGMETSREGLSRLEECDAVADLTIINYGLVDAWSTSIPKFYVPYYPDSFVRKRCRKLVKFTKRMLLRLPAWVWVPRGSVVPVPEFQAKIERMIKLIRKRNPKTVFYLWGTVPVSNSPARNTNLLKYNALLKDIAAKNDGVFIDSVGAVNGLAEADQHLDGVHLSPDAARRIGNQIFQHYLKQSAESSWAA